MSIDRDYVLSEFVYRRRMQFKLTRDELAHKSGLSTFTIQRVENCGGGIRWDTARRIFQALNTTLAEYAAWEKDFS